MLAAGDGAERPGADEPRLDSSSACRPGGGRAAGPGWSRTSRLRIVIWERLDERGARTVAGGSRAQCARAHSYARAADFAHGGSAGSG